MRKCPRRSCSVPDEGGELRLADRAVHAAHVVVIGVLDAGKKLHSGILLIVFTFENFLDELIGIFRNG
jgi:hypothetical protein